LHRFRLEPASKQKRAAAFVFERGDLCARGLQKNKEREMQRSKRYLSSLLFAGAMMVPVMVAGCEAGVRYYDADHRDYHRWNRGEDRYYHLYWSDRHENYREWTSLNEREQGDYWRWRHEHR
jgi:hypothetical protein